MAKLSDAQIKALNEIHEHGATNARKNTFDSIAKYTENSDNPEKPLQLNTEGREILGVTSEESIESLLQGDPWKLADLIDQDIQAGYQEIQQTQVFDSSWSDWAKELAGFGETLNWKGIEVWDGLTASEIREDMESATPINRKARRTHFRTLRNAFRRQTVLRPRKALKITGAVGL